MNKPWLYIQRCAENDINDTGNAIENCPSAKNLSNYVINCFGVFYIRNDCKLCTFSHGPTNQCICKFVRFCSTSRYLEAPSYVSKNEVVMSWHQKAYSPQYFPESIGRSKEGTPGMRPPPQHLWVQFLHFHAVLRKTDQNIRLAPPSFWLAPPPLGNPESATARCTCIKTSMYSVI